MFIRKKLDKLLYNYIMEYYIVVIVNNFGLYVTC